MTSFKTTPFRSLALAAAVALACATAQAREFRSADIHIKEYPTTLAVKYMGDQLASRSARWTWCASTPRPSTASCPSR